MTSRGICIICKNTFNLGALIVLHEVRDVYGKVGDRIYICRKCNEEREKNTEIDRLKKEKEEREYQEAQERFTHNDDFDSIIEQRIVDVLSNGKGDETDIVLESGKKLHFWFSEWGGVELEDLQDAKGDNDGTE